MKSTYSVAIIATIFYPKAEWQVRFEFPDGVDFDVFDEFIEDIESRDALPTIDEMVDIASDYLDDEPTIRTHRMYKLSLREFNQTIRSSYDSSDEVFADVCSSVQPSFCRNCGTKGQSIEPNGQGATCSQCGQDTVQSLAISLGVI